MRAATIDQTGPPSVIQWTGTPLPQPKPNELLVRVGAVSVNPIDTYIRSGAVPVPLSFPYIIGSDFAGTIEAVGESLDPGRVGQRVWGSNQGLLGRGGSFAEAICVESCWCYPTPEGESDAEAAAGALVGITAHLGLFRHGHLQAGEWVFVNGGTGGVGSSVVQLAKSAGAHVVTTAGTEEKRARARELGADLALDYHSPTIDDEIREHFDAQQYDGFDLWFETQREPNLERSIGLMRQRGRMILMAGRDARPEFPLGQFYTNDLRIIGFAMFNASAAEQRDCGESINDIYQAGGWRPQIGRTLPLAEAAAAHQLQEENTLGHADTLAGKIVLVAG